MRRMKKQKKCGVIHPQLIKNEKGKTTHVYLSIKDFEGLIERVEEWKKIQKEKGVRWVKLTNDISRLERGKKMKNKRKTA